MPTTTSRHSPAAPEARSPGKPHRALLLGVTLVVFLIWGNSFVAMSYLLGGDLAAARFDWVTLAQARFVPVGLLAGLWCVLWWPSETRALVFRHPWRVLLGGALVVPVCGLAVLFGQQEGVAAPVASLITALCPLLVIALAAVFLGERLTGRQVVGTAIAVAGMALIAWVGGEGASLDYTFALAVTVLAPLCWAIFTILSKPVVASTSPLVWTYTTLAVGALLLVPIDPLRAWRQMSSLDAVGWACLLFLILPSTIFGNAVWAWLLKHLDASVVGLTVFLNPPLTTASKYVLAKLSPQLQFTIGPGEWVGGGLALLGLALAVAGRTARTGARDVADRSQQEARTPEGGGAGIG